MKAFFEKCKGAEAKRACNIFSLQIGWDSIIVEKDDILIFMPWVAERSKVIEYLEHKHFGCK